MAVPPAPATARWPSPSLGAAAGLVVVVAGFVVGMRPLRDNSFFTHLATGRIILDSGSVPTADPYTFTAPGADWLVQSWLASLLYAAAEAVGGANAIRVLMGVTAAALVAVAWRLTRPAVALIPRLTLGVLFVVVGAELWAERPLMLGLLALSAVLLAANGSLDPRWLVPIGWLWVNVHGSFPLGVAYLLVAWQGARLDGAPTGRERRALGWLVLGVLLGAVGPLGLAALTFPVELLQRHDVLQHVVEWRSPDFSSLSQRAFLLQLALVLLALVRRPSARSGLLVVVFTAAALLGARNITVASLVFMPILADAAPQWGSLRSGVRSGLSTAVAATGVAAALVFGAARLDQPAFALRGYPVDALAFLQANEVDLRDVRVATQDVVGNLMGLIYGPAEIVFYDDRFDMFPTEVSDAHLALLRSAPSLRGDLDRYGIDVVLWERTTAAAQRLIADPQWRVLYGDERWVIMCERGRSLSSRIGRC